MSHRVHIDDEAVRRGALELIRQHGKQARTVASRRAAGWQMTGAKQTAELWERIADEVRQIQPDHST
jgi:hypothetical protein